MEVVFEKQDVPKLALDIQCLTGWMIDLNLTPPEVRLTCLNQCVHDTTTGSGKRCCHVHEILDVVVTKTYGRLQMIC